MSTATPPKPYVLVQLQSGEPEYENISREFIKDNIKVTKIERLENTCLSDRFNSELEEMTNHSPDVNLKKCYLYHCTSIEKSGICEEGLGQTMSRTGEFGNGFYFSDSPINCLHHSEFANHPERAMILRCLVILGDCKHSKYLIYFHILRPGCFNPSLKMAPEKETLFSGTRNYDATNFDAKYYDATIDLWKYVAVGVGLGAVGFVATPLIAVAGLGAVGFTSGGVAAGSTAAAIQATIGNVAAGSAFAMAQSAAATGAVGVGTQLAGGTIFGATSAAVMKLFKNKTQTADASQEK
ncbi:hypothetical protein ACJMK2_023718 [Sinanodonta woodiana]|uniref:PARP catalytic domain-containing protein n=1 Tax=Sinanodonta woodiana TaxID=1069815 RepID=A0ABD3T6T1_SINWO